MVTGGSAHERPEVGEQGRVMAIEEVLIPVA